MKMNRFEAMNYFSTRSGLKELIKIINLQKSRQLTMKQASKALGVSEATYCILLKEYENGQLT